jgi:hypothetical protein
VLYGGGLVRGDDRSAAARSGLQKGTTIQVRHD